MQNSQIFINSIRFVALVLLQVLVLNNINFLGYINPYAYILFIILFPFNGNKSLLVFLSFLLGLTIDMFGDSGGIHAAACSLIGFARPLALKYSFGVSYEISLLKLNKTPLNERVTYVATLVVLHHLVLFILEIFNISHILLVLKSTLFSSIFSIILIFSALLLFNRKE